MNGLRWTVDFAEGHKTGHYLDQQVNYASVGALAAGASEVLDCFTYTGGFALHAAQAGARNVLALDQSEAAVAAGRAHAETNGLAKQVQFEAANVFDWLKERTAVGRGERVIPRFDLIVLDPPPSPGTGPPSPMPSAATRRSISGRSGCSSPVACWRRSAAPTTFIGTCSRRLSSPPPSTPLHAPPRGQLYPVPDHPVIPAIPETEYLKGFAYERVR